MDLSGVLVPVTTPFDPVTGEVDVVGFRSNLRELLERGVRGIVIAGSTGEAVLLDEDERRHLGEAARDVIPPDRVMVVGTGAESTRTTLHLCHQAEANGADAVLVMPPSFYRGAMTPDVLAGHYRRVADESRLPVIIYQVPLRFSTLDLSTGLVAELSGHEKIVGIKDSRGDLSLVGELVESTREGFQVLVGNGALLYAALEVGAVGGVLGVANLAPGVAADLVSAFGEGRTAESGKLQERVGPVHTEIVGGLGVSGVKAALDLLGLRGGDPRPPLRPLREKEKDRVRRVLERAELV